MYKVIALMGEAGTGKDTLMQKILKENPGKFNEIISCTTRPMREGEVHGVNYYYLTPGEFIDRLSKNEMFEMAEFNGWYYGMSVDALKEDTINIGVLNPEGIRSLLAHPDVDVMAVFRIVCRKKTRLLRQLNREENPNVDEIIRRYSADERDFGNLQFKYFEVRNEDVEDLGLAVDAIMVQTQRTSDQGQE